MPQSPLLKVAGPVHLPCLALSGQVLTVQRVAAKEEIAMVENTRSAKAKQRGELSTGFQKNKAGW